MKAVVDVFEEVPDGEDIRKLQKVIRENLKFYTGSHNNSSGRASPETFTVSYIPRYSKELNMYKLAHFVQSVIATPS